MTFQVKMPRCGDSYRDVDHNITFRASGCTGLNMQHPATLTVELATCQYKMPAPQCRGTITLPICKKPKPILYEASRNTHKLLGERVSVYCKWRFNRLFNHTWRQLVSDMGPSTIVAVNVTAVNQSTYSVFGEFITMSEMNKRTGLYAETTLVMYTLIINSVSHEVAGRYHCDNDLTEPTYSGCINVFVTGE
ncbi:hypothetical protein NP493_535g00012 [Ridgeia piscesae]|uniref:Uncharacterized protein n=1 Tax=Ridgeia piscesae TaxID=27915 RepID=A0AAD9NT83_RIDPI|nr:hypothetical protein NP493_535g00012 [Ridgeia piscesae]